MLHHTRKIRKIYEDIQTKLYYMIPEKWEKLYLYSSVIDKKNGDKTGELYFYYIPRGILKKKPVNVYEIPNKFNIDENEYVELVKILYEKIKELREAFKETGLDPLWTNLTMSIEELNFKVEYFYSNLSLSTFDSYERHIIWRYKYLGIGPEQVNSKDRQILNRYFLQMQHERPPKKDVYLNRIYVRDFGNMVAFNTTEENEAWNKKGYKIEKEIETPKERPELPKKRKNQILLSQEEMENLKMNKGGN